MAFDTRAYIFLSLYSILQVMGVICRNQWNLLSEIKIKRYFLHKLLLSLE